MPSPASVCESLLAVGTESVLMRDDLGWDTLDTEIAYSCPGFDIRRDRIRFPDGSEGHFDYLVDEPAVVILPFTETGDVVVIEEWRQAVDRINRGLPAGGREAADTDIEATAYRELTEETGYVADRVEHLVTLEPANGITDAVHHYYVAYDCIQNGEQNLDHNESIRVGLTSYETLREQVHRGQVRDARTALAVFYYDLDGSGT